MKAPTTAATVALTRLGIHHVAHVGGISPFGQREPLPTLLDVSAADHSTVFVSGGRRGFDIELAPADLQRATDARLVAIAR